METNQIRNTQRIGANNSELRLDMTGALLTKRAELSEGLKQLDAAIAAAQEELSSILEQLQTQKRPLEDALRHIDALLQFEGYLADNSTNAAPRDLAPSSNPAGSITDAAVALLDEIHRPMHYKDIAAKLQERGTYIPGRDPAATLLSRMTRDDRFKRAKSRGVYALSTWRVRSGKSLPRQRREVSKT